MASFTPISALIGGLLIGLAASILIVGIGKIMGMSGILNQAIRQVTKPSKYNWQLVFFLGMAVTTWGYSLLFGFPDIQIEHSYWKIIVAGLLVGFGTRLGSGCTSGHGICGISRLSTRSITATMVFLSTGIVTATVCAALS
nr:YeeE/YedE thiosulfate transporter family protein [Psychrobacter lutiphocae]